MALRTIYCVQSYGRVKGRFIKGVLRQFGTETEALSVGEDVGNRVAGVVVFSVTGEPTFDYWEEPLVLARHGSVPSLGS